MTKAHWDTETRWAIFLSVAGYVVKDKPPDFKWATK